MTGKRKSSFLAVVLSVAMTMSVFCMMPTAVSASTSAYTGQTSSGTYLITTASQLKTLADAVDAGNSYAGSTFKLSGTIDMTAYSNWQGIGATATAAVIGSNSVTNSPQVNSGAGFAGTIDGATCGDDGTITAIATVNIGITPTRSGTGLVGYLASAGKIKNLQITGSISAASGYDAIGSAAGFNAGTIENVSSSVRIGMASSGLACYNVGGITGFNTGTVTGCTNSGEVYTTLSKVGGITGENAGTISGCTNSAAITSTYSSKGGTGGIAGRNGNNNTAVEVGRIENCTNSANITCSSGKWVGGIAGFQNSLSSVTNCSNSGTITGYGYADSLVGKDEGTSSSGSGATTPATVTIGGNTMQDLVTAIESAHAGGTILINQTVNITENVTRHDSVTLRRADDFDGTLINVNPDTNVYVTLTSMTVDGDGRGTLFDITSGRLRLRGNIKLQNAAKALNITGGTAEVNKCTLGGTISADVAAAGTFIINNFGGSSVTGTVNLASGAKITLESSLADFTDSVAVTAADTALDTVIAECSSEAIANTSLAKLNVNNGIDLSTSGTQIVIY